MFDEIEPSSHSHIIDSDGEDDEADTVYENDEENSRYLLGGVPADKSAARSFGSDKKSNVSTSIETADLTDDLEGQRYLQSIFRPGLLTGNNSRCSSNQPKKRVTLVEPGQSWAEEKQHMRIQQEINKTERRVAFCRKAVYFLFFLSFLAVVIGGGLYVMEYYNIIDLGDLKLGGLKGDIYFYLVMQLFIAQ